MIASSIDDQSQVGAAAASRGHQAEAMSGEKVLVVEDEENIARLVRMYLENDGFSVVTATDGQAAVEKFEHEQPDLVVLDLLLPKVDGLEVCRRIRARSFTPILMLTARRDEVDRIVDAHGPDDEIGDHRASVRERRDVRYRGGVARGRFAPSPTGDLHLGGARAALVAWLGARTAHSSFVLRVEDLDGPRTVPGAAARILEDLRWLGLDWDEGPPAPGYRQTERVDLYREHAARLVKAARAYYCDCPPALLEEQRRAAEARKETCR